ncbi:MAG: TolC family protein [Betaproteobacteria bacterium]|nr:TolC family protein [Betaproteobacteria bacterium]
MTRTGIAYAAIACAGLFSEGVFAQVDPYAALTAEALANNPEIRAARAEREAARQRVYAAGALDDPMVETGVVNMPATSRSLTQEDMTMKMIGLSQRLPFPGKRDLRRELAARDADASAQGYRETVNRVLRELRIAVTEVQATADAERIALASRDTLQRLLRVAEARYAVGQGSQADVLRAQTQVTKMSDELARLARERANAQNELSRLLARHDAPAPALDLPAPAEDLRLDPPRLLEEALRQRPQLLALRAMADKGARGIDLARKDGWPDFDLRLSYGQRSPAPDGMRRENVVSFTVAFNLPVWRGSKTEPRIAEAHASRDQAVAMLDAQQQELGMRLHHQVLAAEQELASLRRYEREILPQARLTVDAAASAYRVGRVDFLTLLDNQMAVLNYETARVRALASHRKALAEIDFLTGRLARAAQDGPELSSGARP